MAVGTMTDREFQDWLNTHGGEKGRSDDTKPTKSQDPATGAETAGEQVLTTVVANDGATMVIRRIRPSGEEDLPGPIQGGPAYEIVSQSTAAAKPGSVSATPNKTAAEEAKAAEDKREREYNQAHGNGYKTHDEVKADKDKEAAAADAKAKAQAEADRAKNAGGTIVPRPDGTYIIKPDGTTIKTDLPGVPGPSSTTQTKLDDGSVVVVRVDADGNVTTTEAVKPTTVGKPIPASATGWSPDPSKPDMGIIARKQEIAAMLESGVFGDPTLPASVDKANVLLKQDYETANLVSANLGNIEKSEGTVYAGAVNQRTADQNQANTRLQQATKVFDGAIQDIFANAGHLKGSNAGAVAVGAINAILAKTQALAEQFGGLMNSPTVQPGTHMNRTAPEYQPIVKPTPGEPAMAPVVQPGEVPPAAGIEPIAPPTITPAAPFVPPPSGAPATAPPTQGPYAPVAPVTPMSEQTRDTTDPGYPGIQQPTSITDRAQQARQMFGAAPPQVAPPAMPPVTSPNIAAAGASPLIQQAQAPTQGGTLSWARSLGFDPAIIDQWIAMQGQQPAA